MQSPWMRAAAPITRRAAVAVSRISPSTATTRPLSSLLTSTSLSTNSRRRTIPPNSNPSPNHIRLSSSGSRWKLRQGSDPFARSARVQGLKSRAAFKLLELDSKYHLFRRGKGQVVVDLGFAPGSWSQVAIDRTAPNGTVVGIDIIPAQPPKGVSAIQGNFLSTGVQGMVKQFLLEGEKKRRAERATRRAAAQKEEEEEGAMKEEGGEGEEGAVNEVADRPSYIDLERMAAAQESGAGDSSSPASPSASRPTEDSTTAKEAAETKEKANLRLVDVVLSDMSAPWPQTHGFSINSLSNPYTRMMNTSGIAFKDHVGSMDLCHAALSFASETLKPGGHFVCKFYQGAEDKALEMTLKKMFAKVHREKPESSRSESRESFFVALRRKGDVTLQDVEGQS